jgi:putative sterol carrier protein
MRPTLQIELATQTLHRILLGELGLRQAFTRGQLKVRGPVHRIMVLANLFDELQKYYPQVLQEQCLASNR